MNFRRAYDIAFVGLKPGIHEYEYRIDGKFFEHYDEQDFSDCQAVIRLKLDKKTNFMMLVFDVDGKADLWCDRCGNPLTVQLWDEFKLTVKMVDDPDQMNEEELDPDVFYIGHHESHINVADWIYEFINLSIPLQKICAIKENGEPGCNPEVLKKLEEMKKNATQQSSANLWKGLDQFKN
ncbi:MAG: DUF177 domain-containing protein [Bacteroidetes bacterium]|nr:DUF177 domain-containing protein [Bacteroidota bacterium]